MEKANRYNQDGLLYKYMNIWIYPPLKRPSKRVSKCDNPVVDAGASWHCGSGRLPWCWVFRLDPDRSPRFSLREPRWAGTVANKTHNYKKRKEKIMIKEKKRKGKKSDGQ